MITSPRIASQYYPARKESVGLVLVENTLAGFAAINRGTVSTGRRVFEYYTEGDGIFNDCLANASEVASSKLQVFKNRLGDLGQFALRSGLATAGAIGLGVLAVPLALYGFKELREGVKESDAIKSMTGGRKVVTGGEHIALVVGLLGKTAPRLVGQGLVKAAGLVAVPLAVTQVALDTVEGGAKLLKGARAKDGHQVVDGLSDLGMATAVTLGLTMGPAVALPAVCVAMGVKYLNAGLEKRKARLIQESTVTTRLAPQETFFIDPFAHPYYSPG